MTNTYPFNRDFDWTGESTDPNDVQFGDIVESTSIEACSEFDIVLVAEPYDGAVIGRPGAKQGPEAIKEEFAGIKAHHFESGSIGHEVGPHSQTSSSSARTHAAEKLSIGDVGSVDFPEEEDIRTVQEELRTLSATLHSAGPLPIFIGGDNSLSYPNAAGILDAHSKASTMGVISLDAHLDCREVHDKPTSGTPYRQLYEAGLDKLIVIGARDFETSSSYAAYLESRGGEWMTAETVANRKTKTASNALSAMSGLDNIYVSVDIDVLDASAAPGVSAPTPGGITSRELFKLVRELTEARALAGFEIVETAPPLDSDGRTVKAAARTIAHAIAGIAQGKRLDSNGVTYHD